ncbi:ABC transporter substrate-binding protein [Nocardia mangyaensis]|uniref:ABC transporter substrate-binding protein n=1 Tax=Nocardia mangyaensis TaxID=2213200 RepID=UPI002676D53F|nr:ABC transporter substrate-binding protein [Nocardia mangyaensis]MDO3647831.1 ABC transporter substrate-binding protein [Nocardia mangyaensis]
MRVKVATLAVAAILTAAGCAGAGGDLAGPDENLVLVTNQPNASFDPPLMRVGPQSLYWQAVYDTLLHSDVDGEPLPGMASAWSYDESKLNLTLTLREDITFSDGSVFDAAAVKTNVDHFMATPGPNGPMTSAIESVEVTGAHQVVIRLRQPDPGLLINLSSTLGAMAAPAAIARGDLATAPTGSGPYTFQASQSSAERKVYQRNTAYVDPAAYPFDTLEIKYFADVNPVLNQLKTGQVDAAMVRATVTEELEASGVNVISGSAEWAGLLLLDRAGVSIPALGDVRVRQALNYAFDRDYISSITDGNPVPTAQIFNAESIAYDPALEDHYEYDVDKAKSLLAEAGYGGGFTLPLPDLSAILGPAINKTIDQSLNAIGVTVDWQRASPTTMTSDIASGKIPVALFQLAANTPWQTITNSVAPSAGYNPLRTETPELNALIDRIRIASGPEESAAAYKAVNRYVVENAWFVPLFRPGKYFALTPGITTEYQLAGSVPDLSRFQQVQK